MSERLQVALIGARGHTGAELISLLADHPELELAAASSREFAGDQVADRMPGYAGDLTFEVIPPESISSREFDAVILALPNGASGPYVDAIKQSRPNAVIIDLSADHRFDDQWAYGLPEHFRSVIRASRRISNPGCYATAMQLAIRPLLDCLNGAPNVFGISGFSGAGTTPNERNNPDRLRDNLMPYALVGHTHEREASRHLGRPVCFFPHVAPFFRGISLTISMELNAPATFDDLAQRYHTAYDEEPLVSFRTEIPEIRDIAARHTCMIGGLTVDETGSRAIIVSVIDNLLKGAATQAVQNLNLACEFDEFAGIPLVEPVDA